MSPHRIEELGMPKSVDPSDIDGALAALWRAADVGGPLVDSDPDAASHSDSADPTAIVRACGLTVIGLAADEDDLVRVSSALSVATAAVPARTLIVQLDAEVDELRADISALCSLGSPANPSDRQVCREHIVLRAPAGSDEDLAPAIAPLPSADLPAVLFVPHGVPKTLQLATRLLPLIDVVVTDSTLMADPAPVFATLHEWSQRPRLGIRDLAFERLTTWRESLASAWDEAAGRSDSIDAVEVHGAAPVAEAALLAAWIQARLPGTRVSCDTSARSDVESEKQVPGVSRMTVSSGGRQLEFRRFGPHIIRLDSLGTDGGHLCSLPAPCPEVTFLLSYILADPGADPVYDQTLRRLSETACRCPPRPRRSLWT